MISIIKNNFAQYIKTISQNPTPKCLYKYFLEHFIWWKYENVPHSRSDPGLCVCVAVDEGHQSISVSFNPRLSLSDRAVGEDYPASTVLALLFAVWPKVHLQVTGRL